MTPEAFEAFYAQTARGLKSYLLRLAGNAALADEVLQEAYFRLLRSAPEILEDRERKNYLYRIATNLVTDIYRSRRERTEPLPEREAGRAADAESHGVSRDVGRALGRLQPRERELVWLAYVEGSSHREIAAVLGVREGSIRPMLFRAKQKLVDLLKEVGYGSAVSV